MAAPRTRFQRFCPVGELAADQARSRMLAGLPVAVARQAGRLVAFRALCPHQHADLAEGFLEQGGITCPEHLWHFDLATGQCATMPGVGIELYEVREHDGWIEVQLPPA